MSETYIPESNPLSVVKNGEEPEVAGFVYKTFEILGVRKYLF